MKFLLINYGIQIAAIIFGIIYLLGFLKFKVIVFLKREGLYFLAHTKSYINMNSSGKVAYKFKSEQKVTIALLFVPVIGLIETLIFIFKTFQRFKGEIDIRKIRTLYGDRIEIGYIEDLSNETLDSDKYTERSKNYAKKLLSKYNLGKKFNGYRYRAEVYKSIPQDRYNDTDLYFITDDDSIHITKINRHLANYAFAYHRSIDSYNMLQMRIGTYSDQINRASLSIYDNFGYPKFELYIRVEDNDINRITKIYRKTEKINIKEVHEYNEEIYKDGDEYMLVENMISLTKDTFEYNEKLMQPVDMLFEPIPKYKDYLDDIDKIMKPDYFYKEKDKYMSLFINEFEILSYRIRYGNPFRNIGISENKLFYEYLESQKNKN